MLDFFSSSLFSNILAVLGILISLLPQKNSVSIDNSNHYHFENTKKNRPREDSYTSIFTVGIGLVATYTLYALLKPFFTAILIVFYIATSIRYRILGIPSRTQLIVPTLLIASSIILPYYLPNDVTNFWDNTYKIDFNNLDGLSKVLAQLSNPISEIKNLVLTVHTNPLSVAILANIVLVVSLFWSIFRDLTKPKKNIKVPKVKDTVFVIFIFAVIISFMFFTNPHSPSRIVVEKIKYFLSN